MPEERYWIIHRRTGTAIYADRCGRPAPPALHQTARASVPVDSLVARVTTSARRRGNVALFLDHWDPRDWGDAAFARMAAAGPLSDAFRPRPLPPAHASTARS